MLHSSGAYSSSELNHSIPSICAKVYSHSTLCLTFINMNYSVIIAQYIIFWFVQMTTVQQHRNRNKSFTLNNSNPIPTAYCTLSIHSSRHVVGLSAVVEKVPTFVLNVKMSVLQWRKTSKSLKFKMRLKYKCMNETVL